LEKRPVKRLLLKALIEWKQSKDRRPLLLDGARQVGKSYLLEFLFGKEHFNNVFKLNFDEDDNAHALFTPTRTANDVLDRISLYIGKDFDPANDLLFFDEIGYCQQALDSLKYFNEQRPDVLLCASGSNIGLLKSFPVGQNHDLTLYPMTFEEFVIANGNAPLARAFARAERNDIVHVKLSALYHDYLFIGGMPGAVKTWYTSESPIIKKSQEVSYQKVKAMAFSYKGYIAENFAQNELLANGIEDTFGWMGGRTAELEFIVENAHGDVIPIEIKSGKHTKAKSLDAYLKRYNPKKAYKLCDLIGGFRPDRVHTRPLYYTCHAAKSIVLADDLNEYF
jgi:predicted AAA+ superfamily ATPase